MIRAILELAGIVPAKPDPLDKLKDQQFWDRANRPNRPAPFWK